jgi:serine protease Do
VAGLPLKKPSDVTVMRDGKKQTLQVTIEEQPTEYGLSRGPSSRPFKRNDEALSLDKVGLEVTNLTPEWADKLGYKETATGALITDVEAGSPADRAGLRRGMLIVQVDKKTVDSAKGLQGVLAKAALDKGVLLKVQSPQGGVGYMLLKTDGKSDETK